MGLLILIHGTQPLGGIQHLERCLDDCSFQRSLRLTGHLSPLSGSFLKGVLESINSNCDQQVDINWIQLFYHIGMNQNKEFYLWSEFMLHQVCRPDDKQAPFKARIDRRYAVLRRISKTYQVVRLRNSHPYTAAPYLPFSLFQYKKVVLLWFLRLRFIHVACYLHCLFVTLNLLAQKKSSCGVKRMMHWTKASCVCTRYSDQIETHYLCMTVNRQFHWNCFCSFLSICIQNLMTHHGKSHL